MVYAAITVKRRRATKQEMEERSQFLCDYAKFHGAVTVRQLFYQATVAGSPVVAKTESGYTRVQRQDLKLRRDHSIAYDIIADATRWMRKPRTHHGWENALQETARLYRKDLWAGSHEPVEIWIDKSALAGFAMGFLRFPKHTAGPLQWGKTTQNLISTKRRFWMFNLNGPQCPNI